MTSTSVIGILDSRVASLLGITLMTREVLLHNDVREHITVRRALVPEDVEFVFDHLAATVSQPTWVATQAPDPLRIQLVHVVGDTERALHVAVKVIRPVYTGIHTDELWVSTAFPVGRRSLTRMLRTDRFLRVNWEASS